MLPKVAIALVISLGITSAATAAPKQRITGTPVVVTSSPQDPMLLGWHKSASGDTWDRYGLRWE
jgi:hypothetical protein